MTKRLVIMNLENMIFVITGAGSGIGAATARLAASRGAAVVVSDVNDENGEKVSSEINNQGGRSIYQHCNVANDDEIQALMKAAVDAFGGIDVLHNNAGINDSQINDVPNMENMTRSDFEKLYAINVMGPWACAKYALPHLKRSSYASIINAGSVSGRVGYPGTLAYGSSKGALAALTRVMAVELAPHNIRVNCYSAAAIHTPIVEKYLSSTPDREVALSSMSGTHLVGRMGEVEDIAELVCFLASKQASFINGVDWPIDGGSLAWRGTNEGVTK